MISFHLLRPYWLLSFLLLLPIVWYWLTRPTTLKTWQHICDPHLLPYLIKTPLQKSQHLRSYPVISLSFIIFSLSGPAFVQLPTPIFKSQRAHVIVSDFSNTMLGEDIAPNRLQRAKFKLHDLFQQEKHTGQFGLIVYSGEAFVAAPLTDDTHTIDTLLDALTPEIMPVSGNRLESGLLEAQKSIQQAGFSEGSILVITAETPTPAAIETAAQLAKKNITTSILPLLPPRKLNEAFSDFSTHGHGKIYPFSETSEDILSWEADSRTTSYQAIDDDKFSRWRDDGRWFLIPAFFFILLLCRKNYFTQEGI